MTIASTSALAEVLRQLLEPAQLDEVRTFLAQCREPALLVLARTGTLRTPGAQPRGVAYRGGRRRPAAATHASTNLLGNVLANQAAQEAGCIEALLYLPDGTITEASHSSSFAMAGGALYTTPKAANILPGITRGLVLRLAERAGIPEREQSLKRDELHRVEEMFLTGTTYEVPPITRVDGMSGGPASPVP
jgi:branched-subunit amino acid aminotransferase/4-amino-4-deoxychorismate lyase